VDFNLLASQFGKTLDPPTTPAAAATGSVRTAAGVFSSASINPNDDALIDVLH
jgi:hypothetical protein